jgi:hypothetical protein
VKAVRSRSPSQGNTADLRGSAMIRGSAGLAAKERMVAQLSLISWHLLLVVFLRGCSCVIGLACGYLDKRRDVAKQLHGG